MGAGHRRTDIVLTLPTAFGGGPLPSPIGRGRDGVGRQWVRVRTRQRLLYRLHRRFQRRDIAQVQPARVAVSRREQVLGQRDARMPRAADRSDLRHRVGQDFVLAQPRIRQLVHEARIRAILQQAAHQIGKQVAMPADRRIDAAMIAVLAHQPLVQAVAHAMQPLEFEIAAVARPFQDRRHRQRIVAGEGGSDILGRQHVLRHREVRHVGGRLAGEQRVIGQPLDLRALDLAVPIGALDQPDIHHPVEPVRPGDHRPRTLAIGLHRHAEPVPALQARQRGDRTDDVEAHLQSFGFLRIDGQRDVLGGCLHRQRLQHARQRRDALVPPRDFVAGMQRRQFHRDGMPCGGIVADRIDGADIGLEIAIGIVIGARRLAQHVEAGGKALVLAPLHPPHRFIDGAAHHEDLAHHLHRRADRLPHERLAGAPDQAAQRPRRPLADQHASDHQPPGGAVDQFAVRPAGMRTPVRIAQFVGDQQIGRLRIGHAQERLGEAQQRNALRRVETIFLQELVHPAAILRRT